MRQSGLKTFWTNTYTKDTPIPILISIQVILFVVIFSFDLLKEVGIIQIPLYELSVNYLSLPLSFQHFLQQPWSLISFPFLYTGIFTLLFDCLWLFWMGNTFLVFLNKRQLLFIYLSAQLLGAICFLAVGTIPAFQQSTQTSFQGATFGLAALATAIATLVPQMEVRMLLLGNIRLKYIALAFVGLSIIFNALTNSAAAIAILAMAIWGFIFIKQLQEGRDFSKILRARAKKSKLKVVYQNHHAKPTVTNRGSKHVPNQAEVDEILDKISVGGYESLTSREKEVLFKASESEL